MKSNILFGHTSLNSCRMKKKIIQKLYAHFMFNNVLAKIVPFIRYMEKYCRAEKATDDNMALCWIPEATNTHTHKHRCNLHCLSTATIVARTRLCVTLYVHRLSSVRAAIWHYAASYGINHLRSNKYLT